MAYTSFKNIFSIEHVPGKGLGLVAKQIIDRGTRILEEEPILTSERHWLGKHSQVESINQAVSSLSAEKKKQFFSLQNQFDHETLEVGILRTNVFSLGAEADTSGVFHVASRINHACNPNCHACWNPNIKRFTVHTARSIAEGEEITVSYQEVTGTCAQRRISIHTRFNFKCECSSCSAQYDELIISDKRWVEIGNLQRIINSPYACSYPCLQFLRDARKLLDLLDKENIVDIGVPIVYGNCLTVAMSYLDPFRASVFAERAAALVEVLEGKDSPRFKELKNAIADPMSFLEFKPPRSHLNASTGAPKDLPPDKFENWLWKNNQEPPPVEGLRLFSLSSQSAFPCFDDLPGKYNLDEDYFGTVDGYNYNPKKHWCFIGEIIDSITFLRLQIELKDKRGDIIPLFFYTDGRGLEIFPIQIKKGHIVAILYAEKHQFMDGQVGIRHETSSLLKIFPMSLNDLLELDGRIQRYVPEVKGMRACHGCDKKAKTPEMKKCARCRLFWYCDKSCQEHGWKAKQHKSDCKALKDQDLRGLFFLKWNEYISHQSFPLSFLEEAT